MFRWLKCLFGRHDYYMTRRFTADTRQVGCMNCDRLWAMNDRLESLIPWDTEFEKFYEDFGEMYR